MFLGLWDEKKQIDGTNAAFLLCNALSMSNLIPAASMTRIWAAQRQLNTSVHRMQEKNSLSSSFSARFSEAITKFEIKQKDLAKEVNIREQTLSRYKSGSCIPNTEELFRLAKFFGVTMDWLMGDGEQLSESPWKKRALEAEAKLEKYKSATAKLGEVTQEITRIALE